MTCMTMIQIEASTVSEILRATRALSGLSVRDLAPKVGVSHGTISAWERGAGEPSVTQFLRWAQATKQPAQQLLDGLTVEMCTPSDLNREPHWLRVDPENDAAFWAIVDRIEVTA